MVIALLAIKARDVMHSFAMCKERNAECRPRNGHPDQQIFSIDGPTQESRDPVLVFVDVG